MKLFPAIDLRDGKVVRLHKGDFSDETIYGDDPIQVAESFASAGVDWIHVVDLDAAKTGERTNHAIIEKILDNVDVRIQSGGGIRDRGAAQALINIGVSRIVLGTVAMEQPAFVEDLANDYPGKIAVGLDARNGNVAVHGWLADSDVQVLDMVRRYSDTGVSAFIVTDIERDGTLNGPDLSGLKDVLINTNVDVVASGGVGSLDDLRALRSIEVDGKSLAGVITGKALYEGRFSCEDALAICDGIQ